MKIAITHTDADGALDAAAQDALARTVVPVFNVRNPKYGAKGDGTTNDTAAIQRAIDAANGAGGGVVFFPAGVYLVSIISAVRALTIYAGVILRGAGRDLSTVVLDDGQGNYVELVGGATTSTDLSGCGLEDLAVDQNTAGNPVSAISDLTTNGKARRIFSVFAGQRIAVRRCRFADIDSIQTIVANGSDVADVEIVDNIFDGVGGAVAHDHSTIYTHATGVKITGNRFSAGSVGLAGALTAIETHGSAQVVRDNYVYGYQTGSNITGVSVASIGIVVSGNIFARVLAGIRLWSFAYTGNDSGYGMENVVVSDNTITLDRDAWPGHVAGTGIGLKALADLATRNVRITDNTIRLLSHDADGSTSDTVGCGILWWRSDDSIVDEQLVITGNTIDGAIASGIRCSGAFQRLAIESNVVRNPGLGLAAFDDAFRAGVFIGGAFTDSVVRNNVIVDDQDTATIAHGVNGALTSASGVVVADNELRVASGVSVPPFTPTSTAGCAVLLRQRMAAYTAPVYATVAGSTIEDLATGDLYVQTATPAGATWVKQFRGGQLTINGGTTIKKHLSATASWNPPSVADGATTSTTVTVTGAVAGDTVAVGFNVVVPAGALLVGAVTAANTVTVTLFNKTGSTLDLGSGTVRADVWQH